MDVIKKVIIFPIIFLIITFGIHFVIQKYSIYDGQDACLESGVCKEGLPLKMNDGKEVIITETTCKEYDGKWREKFRDCFFR